jgi:hypothetical protein
MANKYHRQGFALGTAPKVGKALTEFLRKNMSLTDSKNIRKKDEIIKRLDETEKKRRKNYTAKEKLQEEPATLDVYLDVIQSDFKKKVGPYYDREKRRLAEKKKLKQLKGKK